MHADLIWLIASTLFFLGGFAYVTIALRSGRYQQTPINLSIMAGGFVCQSVFLYLRGEVTGRCPITNPYEILVFVSWSAVLLYFVLGQPFRLSLLGAFTAPMVSFFQLLAIPFIGRPVPSPTEDYWLEMHASVSLLAYGAFALACIAGVMFMVQHHLLKRAQLESLSFSLPPVTNLSHAIVRLMIIGLVLLTVGILSGFKTQNPPSALHLILSFSVWLVYATVLGVKIGRGLPCQQTAQAAVGAFALPILTLMLISH